MKSYQMMLKTFCFMLATPLVSAPLAAQNGDQVVADEETVKMQIIALGMKAQAAYEDSDFRPALQAADGIMDIVGRLAREPNRDPAKSFQKYAVILHNNAFLFAAERLFDRAYRINVAQLGDYHPFTLSSLNNLASNLNAQKRHAEARIRYEQVLRFRRLVLGSRDLLTINAMANLGYTFGKQGNLQKAEKLLSDALDLSVETLGQDNRESARMMILLADVIDAQLRPEEVENYYLSALKSFNAHGGPFHADTIACLQRLGDYYTSREQHAKAEQFFYHVWTRREQTLGQSHSDTLMSRKAFSDNLLKQGLQEEAAKILGTASASTE